MNNLKTGVLLINLGTPDSPSTGNVRKYLREFLMDRRVIDIPFLNRWALVNLIIAPFRAPKSAKVYQEVWTEEGSPLLTNGLKLKELLQKSLGENFVVELGMRYQNPSIEKALETFKKDNYKEIVVIPLYPQYASATTGSTIEEFNRVISKWEVIPSIRIISNFVNNMKFISSLVAVAQKKINSTDYEHFVFSYHGLPERQIHKSSCNNYCQLGKCCDKYTVKNYYCYRAQCFETTRLLTAALRIPEKKYTICFQSRLGKDEWIKPYAETVIHDLREKGIKKVLAFSPAFVADCLETTIEVGEEYKEEFLKLGGETWDLVDSLNTEKTWVECLKSMIID